MRSILVNIRAIFIINEWSHKLILTTRKVRNGCLGVARTTIFYYSHGQNQILGPIFNSNYTPITTKNWSHISIKISPITKLDDFEYFEPFYECPDHKLPFLGL